MCKPCACRPKHVIHEPYHPPVQIPGTEGNSWILDRYFNESRVSLIPQRSDITGSAPKTSQIKSIGCKSGFNSKEAKKVSIAAKIRPKAEKQKDRIKVGIDPHINVMIFFSHRKVYMTTLPQQYRPEDNSQPRTWRSCYPIRT